MDKSEDEGLKINWLGESGTQPLLGNKLKNERRGSRGKKMRVENRMKNCPRRGKERVHLQYAHDKYSAVCASETKCLQVRKSRYLFSKKAEMKDIAVLLKLALGLWHMQHGVVLQSIGKCCKMIYKYSSSSGHDSC